MHFRAYIVFLLCLNIAKNATSVLSDVNQTPKSEVETTFAKIVDCGFVDQKKCLYLIADDTSQSRESVNLLIQSNLNCVSVIISDFKYFENVSTLGEYENIFILINSINNLEKIFKIISQSLVWHGHTKFYFLFNGQINQNLLLFIWNQEIINFIALSVTTNDVYTFNGFSNKIKRITATRRFCAHAFSDKFKNLYNHTIVAVAKSAIPYTENLNNQWRGLEWDIFNLFISHVNASKRILVNSEYNESVGLLHSNQADIFVLRIFQISYYDKVDMSYPTDFSNRVIIVPKPGLLPIYISTLQILKPTFILSLLLTFIGLLMILKITKTKNGYILLWGLLLNQSIKYTSSKLVKYLLLLWCLSAMIILVFVQTNILGSLLQPKYAPMIKTMDEVKKSDIKIVMIEYYINHTFLSVHGMKGRYIGVEDYEEMVEVMNSHLHDVTYGYLLPEKLATDRMRILQEEIGHTFYTILDEVVIPGYNVILFKLHSFLLTEFNRFLLQVKEYQLVRTEGLYNLKKPSSKVKVLNITHFYLIFGILSIGLSLSFVCFIFELNWKKIFK